MMHPAELPQKVSEALPGKRVCVHCYFDRWNVEKAGEMSSQGSVLFITQEFIQSYALAYWTVSK